MTIEERKNIILAKIAEMKANGEGLQTALETLNKQPNETTSNEER